MNDIQKQVHNFIHKYLDVQPNEKAYIANYALETWRPLPYAVSYLRFFGNHATGKTRAGKVMEAICKNAVMVSGYSPAALLLEMDEKGIVPIFDDINLENEEIGQILSVGSVKGTRIVRMMEHEAQYVAVHFDVFGYKIILSRQPFRDPSLERRCITISLFGTERMDIPSVLDGEFEKDKAAIQSALQEFYGVGGM